MRELGYTDDASDAMVETEWWRQTPEDLPRIRTPAWSTLTATSRSPDSGKNSRSGIRDRPVRSQGRPSGSSIFEVDGKIGEDVAAAGRLDLWA